MNQKTKNQEETKNKLKKRNWTQNEGRQQRKRQLPQSLKNNTKPTLKAAEAQHSGC